MKLVDLFRVIPTSIEVPTPFAVCNPSVMATGSGWSVLVRALDPLPYSGPEAPYLSSENWLVKYDTYLRPQSRTRLLDQEVRECCIEARNGLEDGRLFMWSGRQWALFSGLQRSRRGYINAMILAEVEGDRLCNPIVFPSHIIKRYPAWRILTLKSKSS